MEGSVADRSLETVIFSQLKLQMPIGASPTAMHKYAHPEGEIATAKG